MLLRNYKKTVVRCVCLLLAGAALQLFTGSVDVSFLEYPWGVLLAVNYLYLLVVMSFNKEKWRWTEHFTGRVTYITSLTTLLILVLLFGLIRQDGSGEGFMGALGFRQMKSSWIFNLFLLHFATVLGIKIVDDLRYIKRHKLHVALVHAAFFAILFAGIFGSGDKIRVRLTAVQGRPVNVGTATDGRKVELPFIIRLKDFSLEEYSPQVHMFSHGNLSKESVTIKDKNSEGFLGKWRIECAEYIEMAGRKSGDSVYIPMNHVGATTAAYVKATAAGKTVEGWISCGSHIFAGNSLLLPDGNMLIMPRREIKKYLSQTEIISGDDKKVFNIAVNSPATIGAWKIYQSGYDSERGRWSTTSVFECVKDNWYSVTHVAMWLILVCGVLSLLVNGVKKKTV